MVRRDGKYRSVLRVAVLLCSVSISNAQEISISARSDSTNFRVGDWIHIRVEATVRGNIDALTPAVKDSLGSFEILSIEPTSQESEPAKKSWLFTLTTFDSGKGYVPPIDFAFTVKGDSTVRIARTNSLILNITTLPVDPQADIKDIKGPLSAPWKFEDLLPYLIAVFIALSVGAGYYYWKRNRRRRQEAVADAQPEIPPHQRALFELRELEDRKLWQQGKIKEYYSESTEIVRRFFEGRWSIEALELTSDEILQLMKSIPESKNVWKEMQSFFTTADLVKFAKYNPDVAEHENELKWAYAIVRAMVPPMRVEKEQVEYAG